MPIAIETHTAFGLTNSGHLYLVYKNSFVVRAGPQFQNGSSVTHASFGHIVAEPGVLLSQSIDARAADAAASFGSHDLTFPDRDLDSVWSELVQFAIQVNNAGLSYNVLSYNSNSFIRTALMLVGVFIDPISSLNMPLPVLGIENFPGIENFLKFDYQINGTSSDDYLYGLGGSQTFFGHDGKDTLHGGDDGDFLYGGSGLDTLFGEAGSDSLSGGADNDALYGGSGIDFLDGGTGSDLLVGGGDGDRYSIGLYQGADVIDDQGGAGLDVLALSTGDLFSDINPNWFSRDGDDLLIRAFDSHGQLALDVRIKNMGSQDGAVERLELYAGDGAGVPLSRDLGQIWAGLNSLPTPLHFDVFSPAGTPAPTVPNSSSSTWTGTSGADVFLGTSGDDVIRGLDGVDALAGGAGDDILLGNGSSDALNGGPGKDLLIDDDPGNLGFDDLAGGDGDDTLVFYGAPQGFHDHGDGGAGNDLALVDIHTRTHGWQATESNGQVRVQPVNSNDEGYVLLENIETVAVLFGSGSDQAVGGNEIDYFEGRDGNDQLYGGGNDDYLDGGAGDDYLEAGSGSDWVDGGSGNDSAKLDLSDESRSVTFVASDAATSSGFTFVDQTHVQNVENFELNTGSGDDRIWLGSGNDTVRTGSGDDAVTTTGKGADFVDGGAGSDRLTVDFSAATQNVHSSFSSGALQVWTGLSYAGAADRVRGVSIEEFVLSGGSGSDDLTGGTGDDFISGNDGNDQLDGGSGNNVLNGGGGNDYLTIGTGQDWADGGAGFDRVGITRLSSTTDIFYDGIAAATAAGFTMSDGVHLQNVEAIDLWTGGGNDFVSVSGRGSNFLYLSGGTNGAEIDYSWSTDAITAGSGPQAWEFSASRSGGTDTVDAFFVSYVTLKGGSANDTLSGVDNEAGVPGDVLIGNAGDDSLSGHGGDDFLMGGSGNDRIDGGSGNDTASYTDAASGVGVNLAIVTAQNTGGSGSDTLVGIENLIGSDSSDVLAGDAHDNRLDGGQGNDIIYGGGGNDVLVGGLGQDQFYGQAGADTYLISSIQESLFATYDAVYDFTSGEDKVDITAVYTPNLKLLTQFIDGSTYLYIDTDGDGVWDGLFAAIGSPLQGGDVLATPAGAVAVGITMEGSSVADTLQGGAGADKLYGARGDDVLQGGGGADLFVFLRGDGRDTISDFKSNGDADKICATDYHHWQQLIQQGSDTLVVFSSADSILLKNTLASTITVADFQFSSISVNFDFNADGNSDLLFRAADGSLASWGLNDTAITGGGTFGNPGSPYRYVTTGDFNGDGSADVLFQKADGTLATWQMSGASITGGGSLGNPGAGWVAIATGDFNGDGKSDLLFRNVDGRYATWDLNSTTNVGGGTLGQLGPQWTYKATGDFNGDGKSDVLFQSSDGSYSAWLVNDTAIVGANMGNPGVSWAFKGVGDFNGDGKADILFENTGGQYVTWNMNGAQTVGGGTIGNPGDAWTLVRIGDFNGDGKSDLMFKNANGTFATWNLNDFTIVGGGNIGNPGGTYDIAKGPAPWTAPDLVFAKADGTLATWVVSGGTITAGGTLGNAGPAWTPKLVGDFNGDGQGDVVFQNADGTIATWLTNGSQVTGGSALGNPGAGWNLMAKGDFNGDGKSDLLFQNAASGLYATWDVSGATVVGGGNLGTASGFTFAGVGDFNGDGRDDILFKAADGSYATWQLNDTAITGGGTIGNLGAAWTFAGTGDFNGDGKADILFHNANGMYATWDLSGTAIIGGGDLANPGAGWSLASITDLNGDGRADLVFANTDGRYATWTLNDTAITGGATLGAPGSVWHVLGAEASSSPLEESKKAMTTVLVDHHLDLFAPAIDGFIIHAGTAPGSPLFDRLLDPSDQLEIGKHGAEVILLDHPAAASGGGVSEFALPSEPVRQLTLPDPSPLAHLSTEPLRLHEHFWGYQEVAGIDENGLVWMG